MADGTKLTHKTVALTAITPHPANVRQGDIGAICQSLETHGQYRPIVVQTSTGHILAGNHTWRAMNALGWSRCAVTYIDVTDDEALRILLVDNRANDLATYDDHGLLALLTGLAETPEHLAGTGFDGDDLDNLLALASFAPITGTSESIAELQDYLGTSRLVIMCPLDVLERFRAVPGNDDLDRLRVLLG